MTEASDAFMRLARNLQAGDIDFAANGAEDSEGPNLDVEKLITEKPLLEANSVSSRATGFFAGKHKVVIDLDLDAALWETSTPGHHHLIIDHVMSWEVYERLLIALEGAGLIQPGYLRACLARKASWIRTPWTKK